MKILFIHPRFVGQFGALVRFLAADKNNTVVFITGQREGTLSNVRKVVYHVPEDVGSDVDPYLQAFARSIAHGKAVYRLMMKLKSQGFCPEVIYGYDQWGATMFVKDAFPDTPFLCYFEWFENVHGGRYNFDPASPLPKEHECVLRCYNAVSLINLQSCDAGISPTYWQRSQFPRIYHDKISVIYDGVDTAFYHPRKNVGLVLPRLGINLPPDAPVITYATRGMEPARGFPQFIRAAALLQQRFPECHIVVAGVDGIFYSKAPNSGKSYKEEMLAEVDLDKRRIHFTGWLATNEYRLLLQSSTVHVYLTKPYVLSWSLIEALSTGCMVVASDTPPVKEVIEDGLTGLLVDFFSPMDIAEKIGWCLENTNKTQLIRLAARKLVEERYAMNVALPKQNLMIRRLALPTISM